MIHALYSAGLTVGLIGYLPFYLARRSRGGRRGVALAQRWGHLGDRLPPQPRCWIHAVSVGEAVAAAPLIHAIHARWPGLGLVVTTVTPTGAEVVRNGLGALVTHRYFPVDLPGPVRRALGGVRPRFFIAMETELWPNFFRACAASKIPAMIANGRISDRSFRRYQRVRFMMKPVLSGISVFGMQSDLDAQRIIALGAPRDRVFVTGSLKADVDPTGHETPLKWAAALGVRPGEPVWVSGSTHRGEEDAVLGAFRRAVGRMPRLRLVLAPRHPERVGEVERLFTDAGLATVRRSALPDPGSSAPVIIVDTVGELADIYAIADVVFVGGSLVPVGGHNLLEPALRGKPVLFGPHVTNFRESAQLLLSAGGALAVTDREELADRLLELLEGPDRRTTMGHAALEAALSLRGGVRETLALIDRFLIGPGALA
jgi:3-deoxy-D-manno-octulosonic-acid transferase